jgi:uncharacterized membrane protein YciS (DUF1049 family)
MGVGEEIGLKFQSTEKLREFLRKVAATTTVSDKFRIASLKYADDESVVPFAFLRDVYEELGPGDRSPIHQLLAGSSFFLESPKPREKSEELKARLKNLQEMVDKRQYDELVHDITKHTKEPEYFSSYKDQLGFGLHVALAMFTGFAFGYTICRSQFRETPVLHAAGGAMGLILGMLVETLLFIVRNLQREKLERITKRHEGSSQEISTKQA